MRKTPVVFVIDRATGHATPVVHPAQAWVLAGEGIATVKFDGSACRWQDGRLWKRFDRKLNTAAQRRYDQGQDLGPLTEALFRVAPEGFVPCESAPDPVTFHWPGWVPIRETDPADRWHREALAALAPADRHEDQTYELVGPSLAKNPYGLAAHALWAHGAQEVDLPDRSFDGLQAWLAAHEVEGLVFHHPDGRRAKVRRKDFGLFWVQEDTRGPRRRRSVDAPGSVA
jgi:hypothetical protein